MKQLLIPTMFLLILLAGCKSVDNRETYVEISTDHGKMKFRLYNETPLHRDNFIRLVKDRFYDELLFHRVISDFMIQGGDPDSKDAAKGQILGEGDLGYSVSPEFRYPQYIHKRGALAAARESDEKNPEFNSSACQFYIVYGKKFTNSQLNEEERKRKERIIQKEVNKLAMNSSQILTRYEQNDDFNGLQIVMDSLRTEAGKIYEANYTHFTYNDSVRSLYRTIGGTPWLDDKYTVFGEIVEGLDVLEKIQSVRTDHAARPLRDIRTRIRIVKK